MIQNILSYSGDILQWGYPTAGIFYNWNDPTEVISYTGILPTAKIPYNRGNYIVWISFIRCPTAEIYPTEGYPTEGISNIGGILQQTDILQQISTVHVTVGMLSYAVSMRISNFIVLIWHSYNNSYYLYNHSWTSRHLSHPPSPPLTQRSWQSEWWRVKQCPTRHGLTDTINPQHVTQVVFLLLMVLMHLVCQGVIRKQTDATLNLHKTYTPTNTSYSPISQHPALPQTHHFDRYPSSPQNKFFVDSY